MPEGGSVNVTASGVLLISGKPVRVYGIRMLSAATGTGSVTLYNGTSTAGTNKFQTTGVANGSLTTTFGAGIFFPGGCYVSIDADTTYVDIDCIQAQS